MPWPLVVLLVFPTLGFWILQHHFQRIAWQHMTAAGKAAEQAASIFKLLGRYRPEHFTAVGWQAHRLAQMCFWAAPLWWIILGLVIAPALGWFGH